MSMFYLFGGFITAFIAGLILTPLVSRLARRMKWLDIPDGGRKQHKKPTPRAGGLAILGASGLGIVYFFFAKDQMLTEFGLMSSLPSLPLILGAIGIVVMGLYDDAFGMGFKQKFVFQFIIAYLMFVAGFRIDVSTLLFPSSDPYFHGSISLALTLLWYVGVMNAVNLIDGLDGLAGGVSLIAFGSLTLIFGLQGDFSSLFILLAMTGAISSFLVFNFNPASIFLGDSGSLLIGFMLATFALQGVSAQEPILSIIVIALAVGFPILDTSVAYIRRIAAGRSPFSADRDHIHHRISERFGLSTKKAVLSLYTLNGFLGAVAIALVVVPNLELRVTILVVAATLVAGFLWQLGYLRRAEKPVTASSLPPTYVINGDGHAKTNVEVTFHKPLPRLNALPKQPTKADILKMMAHLSEAEVISWWEKANRGEVTRIATEDGMVVDIDSDAWDNETFWTLEKV